jgi:hypothetical protein
MTFKSDLSLQKTLIIKAIMLKMIQIMLKKQFIINVALDSNYYYYYICDRM